MRPLRAPRPRSLRGRLVLIAGLLATAAVAVCQLAGLAVVRAWLTDQVDDRLAHFRPPEGVHREIAAGNAPPPPGPGDALPSDYRVHFYDRGGHLLDTSLGQDDTPGPRLPETVGELAPDGGRVATVASAGSSGSDWRVRTHDGPDGMRAVVALPLDTVDGATTKLRWVGLTLGAAAAVGVVTLGGAAVRLGLRPLTRVEQTAQQITAGALRLNVPVDDPDTEVGRLGLALNTMLDRLRTALHRTEGSERHLRVFMADAGHELRTPLTAIQGFAELLLHEPAMSADRRREAHGLIHHNAERMSRLVDDLLLLARLGHGPRPHRETADLLSLCADAVATTAVHHPRHSFTLTPLSAAGPEHDLDIVETTGDPHQLAQILGNLLANAATHTPEGTPVQVRVGTAEAGTRGWGGDRPGRVATGPPPAGTPWCVVEIADRGPGIAPADAAHVFERFYRAGPGGRATPPGTGLGLAIAAAITTGHQGRLELDTAPGQGCTFRLLLPHPGADPAQGPVASGVSSSPAAKRSS
ncbi:MULTISPECIES: sensor histidine kinase [Streptomyces diastaticus group]|uniref:sensor histidine kinase n=1 Tax=Streptomyces diastaticus group TaxID=2849069 RepID=UPI001674A037|nr:HAMP domain-containing sensor histidine kinase [Streptomyces gougerotii]